MAGFLVAAAEAIRGVQCQLLAANEYVVGSVGRFAGPVRQRALDGINANRRLLGCNPADDPPGPTAPFEGGQCDGLAYQVTFNWEVPNGTPPNQTTGCVIRGPVGAASFVDTPSGKRIRISGRSAPILSFNCTNPGPLSAQQTYTLTVSIDANAEGLNQTVTPCGFVDNCGSPDPVFPPPSDFTTNIDITYEGDEGDTFNVSLPFIFSPIEVDFNGNFRFPFTFDFGGNTFTGNLNLNPSIPVSINFPGLNPGEGQGTETLPPEEPGDEVEPLPPGEKIIGVVVQILSIDNRKVSTYSSPGIPPVLVPRAGSVKFAYSIGAATFWSSDIDIKDRRTFIPCPFSQGADAVVASPQIGVNLQFIPIKGFALATVADLAGA